MRGPQCRMSFPCNLNMTKIMCYYDVTVISHAWRGFQQGFFSKSYKISSDIGQIG